MSRTTSRRALAQSLVAIALAPALARCDRRLPERSEVLVLGAGIAGLYAAHLLQRQGISARVIEASGRVGGRLRSLDHFDGAPMPGAAPHEVPYARTLALLAEFGLATDRLDSTLPTVALDINGDLVSEERWPEGRGNRLEGAERSVLPQALADHYLDRASPLKSVDDWMDSSLRELDERSFADELRRLGASAEALRLISILYDGKGIENVSALYAYRRRFLERSAGTQALAVRGGSARLPEAIAGRLDNEIRLRHAVSHIEVRGDGVECRCANGQRYRARFALCAVPWSVLREVVLTPTPPQAQIIRDLPYNKITRVRLGVRRGFWEDDGLPAAMVSDRPFERLRVAASPRADAPAELVCWINGQQAAKLDDWNDDRVGRYVIREIVAARPAAAGNLEMIEVTAWGQDPYALGSDSSWGPGQVTRFGVIAREPWGPVHWIGEHVALRQQGVEGALESAEREVAKLLVRMR